MSTSFAILLLMSSLQLVRVKSYSLSIKPELVQTSLASQYISFVCSAGTALSGCQFRCWDRSDAPGPVLELSRGNETQVNSIHLDIRLTNYSYSGRGLEAGECGVSLHVEGLKWWMIACRVRTKTGGWTYAWSSLYTGTRQPLAHTLTPRESIVLPGGEARFMLKAPESMGRCVFYQPGVNFEFDKGNQSTNSTGRHRYLGQGLEKGECGLQLTNVSEADNGRVWVNIGNSRMTRDSIRFMALIVARSPGAPTLRVVYTATGVTATCVVYEGRPVANITWFLGDEVVRQNSLDDRPGNTQDEWRWPWIQGSIQQTLTLPLQADDDGKVLKCVASHVALARPLEATEIISYIAKSSRYLAITPTRVRVNQTLNHVTITCQTDAPLAGCQFSWRSFGGSSGPLLDPSRPESLQADPLYARMGVTGFRRSGRGLAAGECGVELQVQGRKEWLVGCRVRTLGGGGWLYNVTELYADSFHTLPGFTVSPRVTVLLPGDDAHIMCRLESPMKYCWYTTPGSVDHDFYRSPPSSPSSRHSYYGRGLAERECGLRIVNISERDNGPTSCFAGPDHWLNVGGSEHGYSVVVVAKPPSPAILTFRYEGNQIWATCTVARSRPAASIAWLLDGEIVRWDHADDAGPADDNAPWVWPWQEHSTTQTLRLGLEQTHQGKNLSCRAVNRAVSIDVAVPASTLLDFQSLA